MVAFARKITGRGITITHPRPNEALMDPQGAGNARYFAVRGTLKHLPPNHEIWLLTESEAGGVWPQGSVKVQFDPRLKTWSGKINWTSKEPLKITAVVAPPTSQDFFLYFQKLGGLRNHQYEPLNRVPIECTNRASVPARIP
jgi:hypothetical protein